MYCKYCGKQIEEDAIYCKYCGKNVSARSLLSLGNGFLKRFRELSLTRQIIGFTYCVFLLIWIAFLIEEDNERAFHEMIVWFFCTVIVIPFILLGGWYIYQSKHKKKSDAGRLGITESSKNYFAIVASDTLPDFARANGRMQVVKRELSEGIFENYCQFTSADGRVIRVEFADDGLGVLTAQEISQRKYQLAVNKCDDGSYYLDYIDNSPSLSR